MFSQKKIFICLYSFKLLRKLLKSDQLYIVPALNGFNFIIHKIIRYFKLWLIIPSI